MKKIDLPISLDLLILLVDLFKMIAYLEGKLLLLCKLKILVNKHWEKQFFFRNKCYLTKPIHLIETYTLYICLSFL